MYCKVKKINQVWEFPLKNKLPNNPKLNVQSIVDINLDCCAERLTKIGKMENKP